MKNKEFMFEANRAKIKMPKQRDPNWRTMQAKATSGAGGQHKDEKRAAKQGAVKHKKDLIPMENISEAPDDVHSRLSQMRSDTQSRLSQIRSGTRDTLDRIRSRSSVTKPSQASSMFSKPESDQSPRPGARIEWGRFNSQDRQSGIITKVKGQLVTVKTDQGEEEVHLGNKSLSYRIVPNNESSRMRETSGDTKFRKGDEIMFGYKDDAEGLKKGTVLKVSDTDSSKLLVKTDTGNEVIDVSRQAKGPKFDSKTGKALPGSSEKSDKKEFYAFRLTDIESGSDDDVYQQKTPFGTVTFKGAQAQAIRNIDKYGNPYGPGSADIKGRDPKTAELHRQQDLERDKEREKNREIGTSYSDPSDFDDSDEEYSFNQVLNFYKNASPEQRKEIENIPDFKEHPEQLKKLKQAAGVEENVAASPALQRAHDEERKRRGLPHPDEYLRMIEKKKKEIADMRAQDQEDEKKGVSEGNEPDEAYMDRVISDLHKDARGVRPDHEWGNWWMSLSYKEKAKIFNGMVDELGEGMEEATGDRQFDDMMRKIKRGTKKQATADRRERERQSREQARAAFGPSPADRLSIRSDKGMAEGSEWGEPKEILADVMQTLEREVEWPLTDVMDLSEVQKLLQPIRAAINAKMKTVGEAQGDDWGGMSHSEFKRRELKHELGHEDDPNFERKLREKDRGPWYIRIDGKIYKQKGEPKVFDWKKGANNYALAMVKNRPELKDKILLTKNPTDK